LLFDFLAQGFFLLADRKMIRMFLLNKFNKKDIKYQKNEILWKLKNLKWEEIFLFWINFFFFWAWIIFVLIQLMLLSSNFLILVKSNIISNWILNTWNKNLVINFLWTFSSTRLIYSPFLQFNCSYFLSKIDKCCNNNIN